MLSEVAPGAIVRIAELAPTLKEGDLRVLIAMAVEAKPPLWTLRISSRSLAVATDDQSNWHSQSMGKKDDEDDPN